MPIMPLTPFHISTLLCHLNSSFRTAARRKSAASVQPFIFSTRMPSKYCSSSVKRRSVSLSAQRLSCTTCRPMRIEHSMVPKQLKRQTAAGNTPSMEISKMGRTMTKTKECGIRMANI